ncbi:ATP-dependent DNA helicase pif1 [Fusarium oxysporum f. sp. raphani]|uniref:ATP-dependent DNA helicase pif1 n=1 Tax=Fusarium oxysporum f. sp. raphani TaxID=96318 RepID=A0A8J5PT91_FUSOX|nr:ATP-dependent DNA helicase pif1 [Fusarium oxysporum f. sp. raphani]
MDFGLNPEESSTDLLFVVCARCGEERPKSAFTAKRQSAGQTKQCIDCRNQRVSHHSRSKVVLQTLRNIALRPSSPGRPATKRTDGDAGLSPPNERSGTQPTSPEKLRQLHTARSLFGEPISQPQVVLGTPIPPTQQSLRNFRTLAPSPTVQPTTNQIAFHKGGKDSQDDASKAEAKASRSPRPASRPDQDSHMHWRPSDADIQPLAASWLCNGARGTVYDIGWAPGADPIQDSPCVIMMEFDKYNGPVFLTTPDGKKIVPILSVERDFLIGATFCARTQFPLIVCYAITVHKSQSITEDMIVTDLSCQDFQTGLSYVAVSRVETLEGLMLEAPFDRNHLVYGSPPDGMKMKMRDQELRKRQVLTQNPYMSHNTKNCHGNRSDSLSLTVPTTPSTPNLTLPAPSVASSAPPSIASIPTEKLSIWTFFRYARGSESEFRLKERSDRSGKSSNKRLHYCIACWDKKKSWSTIYTSGARDHLRLNHPSLWKRWLDMEDRQTSSKPKLMPGQQVINSFLLQKDEASRELVLREAYDRPRHLQALLALCARRRLPLNAIEWPELHDLLLSARVPSR